MLNELITHLRGDATLANLLSSEPFGVPGIYLEWAPDHPRPYITVSYDEGLDTANVTSGDIEFDIWGDGTSHVALEPIRNALFSALAYVTIDTTRGPVRFFYSTDGPEQDDDPEVVRWRAVYTFRRGRTEHVT